MIAKTLKKREKKKFLVVFNIYFPSVQLGPNSFQTAVVTKQYCSSASNNVQTWKMKFRRRQKQTPASRLTEGPPALKGGRRAAHFDCFKIEKSTRLITLTAGDHLHFVFARLKFEY